MRITLAILSLMGLLAIGLIVSIVTGLVHIAPLPGVAASAASRPASFVPETSESDPATTRSATEPVDEPVADVAPLVEHSILLNAVDAQLQGKTALMARGFTLVRDGQGKGEGESALEVPPQERHHHAKVPLPFLTRFALNSDAAMWTFTSPRPGRYMVTLVFNCPVHSREDQKEYGPFVLSTRDQSFTFNLKASASARISSFDLEEIGNITLPAGEVSLTIRPKGDVGTATVRIRSLQMIPLP